MTSNQLIILLDIHKGFSRDKIIETLDIVNENNPEAYSEKIYIKNIEKDLEYLYINGLVERIGDNIFRLTEVGAEVVKNILNYSFIFEDKYYNFES
ncbi:MAG: hypothetical protein AABY32_04195 [Nanoarchaeota archaeon]